MYKYFTTRFGNNAVEQVVALRKAFPHCQFAAGVRKDKKGIYAFRSNSIKEYGESWELENGDIFWAPTAANLDDIKKNISKYKTDWLDRISVQLINGMRLEIFPASAIPKKVYFTRKLKTVDSPYPQDVPYGKLAYDLFDRSQKEEKILLDDPQMVAFVMRALCESYSLPEPLWDALQIISYGDFDKIFAAGMGMSWDFLQEELGKSNAQPQPMTGATAPSAPMVGISTLSGNT
jgi:hypothetical protein